VTVTKNDIKQHREFKCAARCKHGDDDGRANTLRKRERKKETETKKENRNISRESLTAPVMSKTLDFGQNYVVAALISNDVNPQSLSPLLLLLVTPSLRVFARSAAAPALRRQNTARTWWCRLRRTTSATKHDNHSLRADESERQRLTGKPEAQQLKTTTKFVYTNMRDQDLYNHCCCDDYDVVCVCCLLTVSWYTFCFPSTSLWRMKVFITVCMSHMREPI